MWVRLTIIKGCYGTPSVSLRFPGIGLGIWCAIVPMLKNMLDKTGLFLFSGSCAWLAKRCTYVGRRSHIPFDEIEDCTADLLSLDLTVHILSFIGRIWCFSALTFLFLMRFCHTDEAKNKIGKVMRRRKLPFKLSCSAYKVEGCEGLFLVIG